MPMNQSKIGRFKKRKLVFGLRVSIALIIYCLMSRPTLTFPLEEVVLS